MITIKIHDTNTERYTYTASVFELATEAEAV